MTVCYHDVELTRVKTVDEETFEKGVTYEDAINALIYAGKYSILVRASLRHGFPFFRRPLRTGTGD
jgi:hypothetical protein